MASLLSNLFNKKANKENDVFASDALYNEESPWTKLSW